MSKLSNLFERIGSWFRRLFRKKEDKPSAQTKEKPVETASATGVVWKSHRADTFFQHGNPNENTYRQNAISAALAAGLDCIRCNVSYGMDDELAMHLLALEHPNERGYYLIEDSWFFKAERQGVKRWVYDMGTATSSGADRWLYLTKSPYYKERLQYVVSRQTPKDVVEKLAANVNGCEVVVE